MLRIRGAKPLSHRSDIRFRFPLFDILEKTRQMSIYLLLNQICFFQPPISQQTTNNRNKNVMKFLRSRNRHSKPASVFTVVEPTPTTTMRDIWADSEDRFNSSSSDIPQYATFNIWRKEETEQEDQSPPRFISKPSKKPRRRIHFPTISKPPPPSKHIPITLSPTTPIPIEIQTLFSTALPTLYKTYTIHDAECFLLRKYHSKQTYISSDQITTLERQLCLDRFLFDVAVGLSQGRWDREVGGVRVWVGEMMEVGLRWEVWWD